MSDAVTRWSQIVRGPGEVEILGFHAAEVPPEGGLAAGIESRPGLRLLTRPVGATGPYYAIDITSSAVIAMLDGFLKTGTAVGKRLSWQTRGFGPTRRDTLIIGPRVS